MKNKTMKALSGSGRRSRPLATSKPCAKKQSVEITVSRSKTDRHSTDFNSVGNIGIISMKYHLVPVFILMFLNSVYSNERPIVACPAAGDIEPCSCHINYDLKASITCSDVHHKDRPLRAFRNTEGYFFDKLTINNSKLEYIPHEIIERTSAKALVLLDTKLNQIFDSPPQGVISFTGVLLDNVEVSSGISWSLFQGFTNLRSFGMIETFLNILGPSFSQYMPKGLGFLFFGHMKIKEIKPGALSQLTNLLWVRIHNCSLTSLTRDIFPQPFLCPRLSIRNNKISSIPGDLFTDMPNIQWLYLDGNLISELPESAFQGTTIEEFNIQGNPLKCDCHMRWLLNREQVKLKSGVCASPERLRGRTLDSLTPEDFNCTESDLPN